MRKITLRVLMEVAEQKRYERSKKCIHLGGKHASASLIVAPKRPKDFVSVCSPFQNP